ncbi:hypothetical protein QEG98_29730 [Myxococcus sp. MxC21-1]|uniref:hypothetical protein n=1 Tax=Myxococcus sp. MxC21-1 TaxID=3041439 RepID=UPI00292F67A2|nr:hypothetical protein [Myxococcus sp. MxC21-1]WNZ60160.1 hypothetical protein QEG98_29730 [Myxococcus sp. MxC21-1]
MFKDLPVPLVENTKVTVYVSELEVGREGGLICTFRFAFKDEVGNWASVAEVPVELVPSEYLHDPRIPSYLRAVPRALTELMNGRGCLWFTPAVALQSEATTEDALVAEIVARSEPMW